MCSGAPFSTSVARRDGGRALASRTARLRTRVAEPSSEVCAGLPGRQDAETGGAPGRLRRSWQLAPCKAPSPRRISPSGSHADSTHVSASVYESTRCGSRTSPRSKARPNRARRCRTSSQVSSSTTTSRRPARSRSPHPTGAGESCAERARSCAPWWPSHAPSVVAISGAPGGRPRRARIPSRRPMRGAEERVIWARRSRRPSAPRACRCRRSRAAGPARGFVSAMGSLRSPNARCEWPRAHRNPSTLIRLSGCPRARRSRRSRPAFERVLSCFTPTTAVTPRRSSL